MLQPLRKYCPFDASTTSIVSLAIVEYYPILTLTSRILIHTSCLLYRVLLRSSGFQPRSAVMTALHLVQCLRKLFTTVISLT